MATTLDFYQILGLNKQRNTKIIPAGELRQAYKRALLSHHPDKKNSLGASNNNVTAATVDDIAEAYKTIGDPKLRAEYDRKLREQLEKNDGSVIATRHTGMETEDLEDLAFDEQRGEWTRSCRCGSQPAYIVTEAELEKNVEFGELITGCKGCSLWLKVLFSVED